MIFASYLQFEKFLTAMFFGALFGAAYGLEGLITRFTVHKWVKCFLDVVFCLLAAVEYILVSYIFHFGEFRLYMPLSFALGAVIYRGSFHYYLQKAFKRCIIKKRKNFQAEDK